MSGARTSSGLICSHGSDLDTRIPRAKIPSTALPPDVRRKLGFKRATPQRRKSIGANPYKAGANVLQPREAADGEYAAGSQKHFLKRGTGVRRRNQRASAIQGAAARRGGKDGKRWRRGQQQGRRQGLQGRQGRPLSARGRAPRPRAIRKTEPTKAAQSPGSPTAPLKDRRPQTSPTTGKGSLRKMERSDTFQRRDRSAWEPSISVAGGANSQVDTDMKRFISIMNKRRQADRSTRVPPSHRMLNVQG